MPSSATSCPSRSTWVVTRTEITTSMSFHSTQEVANTNAPIARMPINCTPRLPPLTMHTANVPQMPANRWAGTAPTTSSILTDSSSFIPTVQMTPPMAPMMIAQ